MPSAFFRPSPSLFSAALVPALIDENGLSLSSTDWALLLGGIWAVVLREVAVQLLASRSNALARRVDAGLQALAIAAAGRPAGIEHLEDPDSVKSYVGARNLAPLVFSPGDATSQIAFSLASRIEVVAIAVAMTVMSPTIGIGSFVVVALAQALLIGGVLAIAASTALTIYPPPVAYSREVLLRGTVVKDATVFGATRWIRSFYRTSAAKQVEAAWNARKGSSRWQLAAALLHGAGFAGGLIWAGSLLSQRQLSTAGLALLVLGLLRIFQPPNLVTDIPVAYGGFSIAAIEAADAASRIEPAVKSSIDVTTATPAELLSADHVSFRYRNESRLALTDVEAQIVVGRRIAVVGESGSGKTTFLKLLMGLYEPTSGQITVDGVDLRSIDHRDWRSQFAVVFQDFIRYDLSVIANIALPGTKPDLDRVSAAISAAGASRLIHALQDGAHTVLSGSGTGGRGLSGGEWQRIALARAFYAVLGGSSILVLDEPTSALDPDTEAGFFDEVLALERAWDPSNPPLTTIIVSHRFATVRRADEILVVHDGRLIERGTHRELMNLDGRYAKMSTAQTSGAFG